MPVTSADQDCLLVYDGLDNPVGLLTDFATNAFTYQYDPWGVQTLTAGGTGNGAAQNPYTFHSGIKDPGSGLIKFGERWYNPATGTWTQQDAIDEPLDPANANRYAYAGDNPINNLDPSGQVTACAAIGAILAIAGVGLGIAGFVGATIVTGGTAALVLGAVGAFGVSLLPAGGIFGILTLLGEC